MKKLLVSLLLVAMLSSAFAIAETVMFDDFTMELADEYSTYDEGDPDCREYEADDYTEYPTIMISRLDTLYSLEDAVDEYSGRIKAVNGIDMVQWDDYDELYAIFTTGINFYMIEYDTSYSFGNSASNAFNSILQTIVITTEASDNAPEPDTDANENNETPADDTSTEEAALAAAAENYTSLEKGSKGEEVKALQQRLVDLYWLSGSVDGDYGNKTKDAVERFQQAAGILPVTGIADGMTQAKLFADNAPKAAMSVSGSVAGINSSYTAYWSFNGQEFTLKGNQSKTLKTPWGTYKFYASGDYEKID